MKKLPLRVIAVVLCAPWVCQGEELEFKFSATEARKAGAAKPEAPGERPPDEVGEVQGPFALVGKVIIQPGGGTFEIKTSPVSTYSGRRFEVPKAGSFLEADLFVNDQGNGFAVVHEKAVEAPMPEAPDDEEEEAMKDDRPWEHNQLVEAAAMAITKGNTQLLKALLRAGLLMDVPLDLETGRTALHYCAGRNQPRAARLLVAHGADPDLRDRFGDRPIDQAFEGGQSELCEVLRKPDGKERMVGEFPEALLDELFKDHEKGREAEKRRRRERLMFVSMNGQDPGAEVMEYFLKLWPNARPRSRAEEVPRNAAEKEGAESCYRDVKTREYGMIVELKLTEAGTGTGAGPGEPAGAPARELEWSHREATGPVMSGGGSRGRISKRHGYWIKHETVGWDE